MEKRNCLFRRNKRKQILLSFTPPQPPQGGRGAEERDEKIYIKKIYFFQKTKKNSKNVLKNTINLISFDFFLKIERERSAKKKGLI